MNGLGPFLGKELREIRKTWRLWVLPGVLLFLGLTTPLLAALTPKILKMTAQRTPGVVIHFPTPTASDSYLQFMGNLAQMALLVIIVTGAAAVAGERRAGTDVLMLTKPLSPVVLRTSSRKNSHSGRASPGGLTAFINFCTRPFVLVKVPRFSA